jgi:heme exporter protein B
LFYGSHVRSYSSVLAACAAGTVGLAAVGTLYGALAAGVRVRETLLPFLLLPVVAPVLLAGTRAWQAALGTGPGGDAADPWLSLLLVFAVVYLSVGVVIFGSLQESG